MGFSRKHFAVVALDGPFRTAAVAPLLNKLISKRADADASDLGIGIASMLGFSDTSKALQVCALTCALPWPFQHTRTWLELLCSSMPSLLPTSVPLIIWVS